MRRVIWLMVLLGGCVTQEHMLLDGVADTGATGQACDDGVQEVSLDAPLAGGPTARELLSPLLGPRATRLTWSREEAREAQTLSWELGFDGQEAEYVESTPGCAGWVSAPAQLWLQTEDGALTELIGATLTAPLESGQASLFAEQAVGSVQGTYRPLAVDASRWDDVTLVWYASFDGNKPVGGLDVNARSSAGDAATGEAQVGRLASFQ